MEEDAGKVDLKIDSPKSIRVFLSYSHLDNQLVGNIKYHLETYGLEVFIAHDDIKPSLEWQEVILQELGGTDIFIPIITENFSGSEWTDQESGIAFAKDKFVIPASIGGASPYGFIGKFQACKLKVGPSELGNSVNNIVKAIAGRKGFSNNIAELIISNLPRANSFDNAARLLSILDILSLTPKQANEVLKHAAENNQIYGSRNARPFLKKHIEKYKKIIESKLIKEFILASQD